MRIAIVGCGRIGSRRAETAAAAGDEVLVVVDVNEVRARELARRFNADWSLAWQEIATHPDIDAVVVATVNNALPPIVIATLSAGKHVLCEKPMGRTSEEARRVAAAARRSTGRLKVGFNHRHHPALSQAHELALSGKIGKPLAIRAAYGHGGRPGYENEWRCDPEAAGGGELIDQGVHLIDLARWFLGEFSLVSGAVGTWVWPIQPLEDNAFALLRTADGRVASMHVSWTQWRNLFRFEVLGSQGYVIVDGLGGSYGPERLTVGVRNTDWSPPTEEHWEFAGPDLSWSSEWAEFRAAIEEGREPLGSSKDGYAAALIVDAIYKSAQDGGATIQLET